MAVAERLPFLPAEIIGNPGSPVGIVRSVAEINIPPRPEISYEKRTVGQTISDLWTGKINPTWIEIGGCCGGQIQVRRWDENSNDWEAELDPAFAWIHIGKDLPLDFRGIFFVHWSELKNSTGIKKGATLKIYADWNYEESPVLAARIGVSAVYGVEKFNDSGDPLVKQIATSTKTLAIVTCDPPGCQGNCFQRKVWYAWASLPK